MTASLQRMFVVWFNALDRWTIPAGLVQGRSLPPGWRIVRLGSLVRQITERVRVVSDAEYRMVGVKWYGEGTFHRETVRGESLSASYVTPVKVGALIYNRLFAWKASFAVVPPEHSGHFVSGEFPQFVVDEQQVLPTYLYLYFSSPSVIRAVNSASVGSSAVSRNRFRERSFLGFEIPLPPIATQRAILAEWEKARAAITAAEETARKIEAEIESHFFTDLGLRIPNAGAAPKFFAVHWTDFLRWSVSYNQTALTGMDLTRGLFPVVTLGSVLELVQYGTSEKANSRNDGVPVIRMNNIVDGMLDLSNLKHVALRDNERQKLTLCHGDILFNRTNSKELVGKCAVFHAGGEYVFASYLIRVRVQPQKADPDFIVYALNTAIGRQQIDAMSRQIIGQANINSQELRSLRIPLPPLAVQRRIMEKVAAGRARIARERETARALAAKIAVDMEAYLLGTKKGGVA